MSELWPHKNLATINSWDQADQAGYHLNYRIYSRISRKIYDKILT